MRTWMGVIAAFLLGVGPASASDWPMFQRDAAHTGDAAEETLRLPLKLATCVRLEDAVTTSPTVVGGRVYVVDQMGTAYCIDPRANRVLWRSAPEGGRRPRAIRQSIIFHSERGGDSRC